MKDGISLGGWRVTYDEAFVALLRSGKVGWIEGFYEGMDKENTYCIMGLYYSVDWLAWELLGIAELESAKEGGRTPLGKRIIAKEEIQKVHRFLNHKNIFNPEEEIVPIKFEGNNSFRSFLMIMNDFYKVKFDTFIETFEYMGWI